MKSGKIFFLFLLLSFSECRVLAQDTAVTFYSKGLEVTKKKNKDGFYIKSLQNGNFGYRENRTGEDVLQSQEWDTISSTGQKKTRYIEYTNGIKAMEGNYLNEQKDGTWLCWHQSGNKKEEGAYVEGIKHGEWATWYENGEENSRGWYKGGVKSGLWKARYKNGRLSSILNFEEDLEQMIPEIKADSSLYQMVKRYEGVLNGSCCWFFPSGDTAAIENYSKGKLISVRLCDSLGRINNLPVGAYTIVKKPEFKGDINAFLKSNIKYPRILGAEGGAVKGQAIIEFAVKENGDLDSIRVVKSSGYFELDREVIRVVKETQGKWMPGSRHNIPAEMLYWLPVAFQPHL